MPDHVHPLLEAPPTVALSPLIQRLKGRSSRLLRLGVPPFGEELPQLRRGRGLWLPSWFVSTVGGAPPPSPSAWGCPHPVVRRYVENQKLAG